MKHVIGAFGGKAEAERAVQKLESSGFTDKEVSLIAKGEEGAQGQTHQDGVGDGTAWGAGIGGAAGLLASIGLIAIPGVGPILAAGPLAAALTGAATGGIAGGLVDYGIPEQASRKYEQEIKQGQAVVVVDAQSEDKAQSAQKFLKEAGAHDIEID